MEQDLTLLIALQAGVAGTGPMPAGGGIPEVKAGAAGRPSARGVGGTGAWDREQGMSLPPRKVMLYLRALGIDKLLERAQGPPAVTASDAGTPEAEAVNDLAFQRRGSPVERGSAEGEADAQEGIGEAHVEELIRFAQSIGAWPLPNPTAPAEPLPSPPGSRDGGGTGPAPAHRRPAGAGSQVGEEEPEAVPASRQSTAAATPPMKLPAPGAAASGFRGMLARAVASWEDRSGAPPAGDPAPALQGAPAARNAAGVPGVRAAGDSRGARDVRGAGDTRGTGDTRTTGDEVAFEAGSAGGQAMAFEAGSVTGHEKPRDPRAQAGSPRPGRAMRTEASAGPSVQGLVGPRQRRSSLMAASQGAAEQVAGAQGHGAYRRVSEGGARPLAAERSGRTVEAPIRYTLPSGDAPHRGHRVTPERGERAEQAVSGQRAMTSQPWEWLPALEGDEFEVLQAFTSGEPAATSEPLPPSSGEVPVAASEPRTQSAPPPSQGAGNRLQHPVRSAEPAEKSASVRPAAEAEQAERPATAVSARESREVEPSPAEHAGSARPDPPAGVRTGGMPTGATQRDARAVRADARSGEAASVRPDAWRGEVDTLAPVPVSVSASAPAPDAGGLPPADEAVSEAVSEEASVTADKRSETGEAGPAWNAAAKRETDPEVGDAGRDFGADRGLVETRDAVGRGPGDTPDRLQDPETPHDHAVRQEYVPNTDEESRPTPGVRSDTGPQTRAVPVGRDPIRRAAPGPAARLREPEGSASPGSRVAAPRPGSGTTTSGVASDRAVPRGVTAARVAEPRPATSGVRDGVADGAVKKVTAGPTTPVPAASRRDVEPRPGPIRQDVPGGQGYGPKGLPSPDPVPKAPAEGPRSILAPAQPGDVGVTGPAAKVTAKAPQPPDVGERPHSHGGEIGEPGSGDEAVRAGRPSSRQAWEGHNPIDPDHITPREEPAHAPVALEAGPGDGAEVRPGHDAVGTRPYRDASPVSAPGSRPEQPDSRVPRTAPTPVRAAEKAQPRSGETSAVGFADREVAAGSRARQATVTSDTPGASERVPVSSGSRTAPPPQATEPGPKQKQEPAYVAGPVERRVDVPVLRDGRELIARPEAHWSRVESNRRPVEMEQPLQAQDAGPGRDPVGLTPASGAVREWPLGGVEHAAPRAVAGRPTYQPAEAGKPAPMEGSKPEPVGAVMPALAEAAKPAPAPTAMPERVGDVGPEAVEEASPGPVKQAAQAQPRVLVEHAARPRIQASFPDRGKAGGAPDPHATAERNAGPGWRPAEPRPRPMGPNNGTADERFQAPRPGNVAARSHPAATGERFSVGRAATSVSPMLPAHPAGGAAPSDEVESGDTQAPEAQSASIGEPLGSDDVTAGRAKEPGPPPSNLSQAVLIDEATRPAADGSDRTGTAEASPDVARSVVDQVVTHATMFLRKQVGASGMVVQLKPESLGRVRLSLVVDRSGLHAKIEAQTALVEKVLSAELGELKASLEKQGTRVSELMVVRSRPDAATASPSHGEAHHRGGHWRDAWPEGSGPGRGRPEPALVRTAAIAGGRGAAATGRRAAWNRIDLLV